MQLGINGRMDSQRKEMLMVVGVGTRVHLCAPAMQIFSGIAGESVEDAGELNLQLDGTVLVENPVDAVFVVCGGENLRQNELGSSSDDRSLELVSEVRVLEKQTIVLLVDTHSVGNSERLSFGVGKVRIKVVHDSRAITSEGKRIGHETGSVLSQIKGVLSLVRVLGVSVGNNHFNERETMEHVSLVTMVIERDLRQHNSLSVVESHVKSESLPLHDSTGHLEVDSFGLRHVDGLHVSVTGSLGDILRIEVGILKLGERSTNGRNINKDDFLLRGVVDWSEVKRMGVLGVVLVGSVVEERLL